MLLEEDTNFELAGSESFLATAAELRASIRRVIKTQPELKESLERSFAELERYPDDTIIEVVNNKYLNEIH